MKLAFIGFGEAAQAMALGFKGEKSLEKLSAYDIRIDDPAQTATLKAKAAELGVFLAPSVAEAVAGAPIALSMVQGSAAVKVAESVAPYLTAEQILIDLNSIGPDAKLRVADAVRRGPGACVEGAIMDAVRPKNHKVPILLAGPRASEAADMLNAVGMKCEAIGEKIGQACSVKMIRSVMMKGVEALILESMRAAETAGVTERILDSVNVTFEGLDWRKLTSHYLKRTHEHGARRVSEMKESAATLKSLGLEPRMSLAIAETIAAGHAQLLSTPYDAAAQYPELLKILVAAPAGVASKKS
jgi:3-hydroxyisobutyrate dehydrogenase-like beta-hydroxyacid dehydrogenase